MTKLKANTRFYNVFDGKIYDKGDVFSSGNKNDVDYLIENKIASIEKEAEEKKEKEVKPKK